jgi:hypothetical protein
MNQCLGVPFSLVTLVDLQAAAESSGNTKVKDLSQRHSRLHPGNKDILERHPVHVRGKSKNKKRDLQFTHPGKVSCPEYINHVFKISKKSQVPVAHACNPSCSGGRDQEDCGSKPARANTS